MKLSSGIPNAPELLSCGALTRGRMKVTLYISESVVPVADFCMMNLTVNTFIKEKTGESGRF